MMIFLLFFAAVPLYSAVAAQSETAISPIPTTTITNDQTLLSFSTNNASATRKYSSETNWGITWSRAGTGTLLHGNGTGPQISEPSINKTSSSLLKTTTAPHSTHRGIATSSGIWQNSTLSSTASNGPSTRSIVSDVSSPAIVSTSRVVQSSSSFTTDAINSRSTPGVTWLSSGSGGTPQTSTSTTPFLSSALNSTSSANSTFTTLFSTSQITLSASNGSLIRVPVPVIVTIPRPETASTSTFPWIEVTDHPDPNTNPPLPTGITSWDEFEVTRTETVTPSGMSIDKVTNTEWKKNFWLSTTGSDVNPTEVPVVHCGCICQGNCQLDDVDGLFVWVVYWNVPRLPNVQFSFPKLPDFHFPKCIKIFGISLGKCPPKSDNGRKKNTNKDPDDPRNRNREPDDPEDGDGQCEKKSVVVDTTFSTVCPESTAPPPDCSTDSIISQRTGCNIQPTVTSTSTVSCRTELVTDTVTHTICPTEGANSKNCTTTTSTSVRSGCDITASNTATFTATCSSGPVTDLDVKTLCPTSGASSSQCSTITSSIVRTGHCLAATASSTYSATSIEACGHWNPPVDPYGLISIAENTTGAACGTWVAPPEPYGTTSVIANATTSVSKTSANSFLYTSAIPLPASNISMSSTLTTLLTLVSQISNGTGAFEGNKTLLESSRDASEVPILTSSNDVDATLGSTISSRETSSKASNITFFTTISSTNHNLDSTLSSQEASSIASDVPIPTSSNGTNIRTGGTTSPEGILGKISDISTSTSGNSVGPDSGIMLSPQTTFSDTSKIPSSIQRNNTATGTGGAAPVESISKTSDTRTLSSDVSSNISAPTLPQVPTQSLTETRTPSSEPHTSTSRSPALSSEAPAASSEHPNSSAAPLPSPRPKPRDPDECYHRRWGAPKMEADKESTPAYHRISKFCNDNHGVKVGKDAPEDRYIREDISGWGIPKRQSYWIRANAAPFSQCQSGRIDKQDCIDVLYNAVDSCDSGDYTFGARAQGGGCVQYTFDISDVVSEGEPPWHELLAHYPGIERLELYPNSEEDPTPQTSCPNIPDCQLNDIQCKGKGPGFSLEDADQAIEDFCRQEGEHDPQRLTRVNGFGITSFFAPEKYLDTRWCMQVNMPPIQNPHTNEVNRESVDGQGELIENKLEFNDCKYALSKMVHHCGDANNKIGDGRWYYRCVGYMFSTQATDNSLTIIIDKRNESNIAV